VDPQTTQAPPQAPFAVALPQFEGPLDLLLSLIQEHKLDIFDVPIAFLTARYLEYLEHAREVDLDLAGEYLVMAATLAHIKSRMLLPREEAGDAEGGEVGPDPREELIRRLLEYQKYKTAARDLAALPQLGRDVFARRAREELPLSQEEVRFLQSPEVSVYRLIEALAAVLRRRKIEIPHEVFVERLSIGDRIAAIADRLRSEERIAFTSLFADLLETDRHRVVPTFLALLEMARLKLVRIYQAPADEAGPGSEIVVEAKETLGDGTPGATEDYR
jgi:segregation and condensation protein A